MRSDAEAAVGAPDFRPDVLYLSPGSGWSDSYWEIEAYLNHQSNSFGLSPSTGASQTTLVQTPNHVSADSRIAYHIIDATTLAVSGQNPLQPPRSRPAALIERQVFGMVAINF